MADLAEEIRGLSRENLALFKRQLASLPEKERQLAFSRLSGIPELSDIVGSRAPKAPAQPTQPTTLTPMTPTQSDVPLWKKALSTVTAPLRWAEENITQPFGAIVTSPFTPSVPGTEGMNWLERERAEYKEWDEPSWTTPWGYEFRPTKGLVETLPWLLVPSAGGVLGRAGAAGLKGAGLLGLAQKGGQVGRIAGAAAKVVKPVAAAERAITYPIAKPMEILGAKATRSVLPSRVWKNLSEPERVALSKEVGISENAASKVWQNLGKDEKSALTDRILRPSAQEAGQKMPETVQRQVLSMFEGGRPGLNTSPTGLSYLSPEGKVIAAVTLNVEPSGAIRIGSVVADEKSLLKGRATKAILDELENTPNVILPPASEMSPQGLEIAEKFQRKQALKKEMLTPEPKPMEPPPTPPIKPPRPTQAVPEGFSEPEQEAVGRLVRLFGQHKSVVRETGALRKPEYSRRIAAYDELIEIYEKEGLTAKEAHNRAKAALKGSYPTAELPEASRAVIEQLAQDEQVLFQIVDRATYASDWTRFNTREALQDLLLLNPLQGNQIRLLEETFGSDLARQLLKNRSFGAKAAELLLDLANAPRALLASGDLSGLLRQGGILFARHPIEGLRSVKPMLLAMFSDANEVLMDNIIRSRAHFVLGEKAGLFIAPRIGKLTVKLGEREEALMSKTISKLPFIRASNRAYVTGLNDLRSQVWEKTLTHWEKAGIKYGQQDLTDLAQLINWATGRGTLPSAVRKQGALLNSLLFSPRLILSRLQLPTTVLPWVTKSKLVRQEAWRTLLSAIGVGSSIVAAAVASGQAETDLDPRSADFGKLKVGETRLDIWTGYVQYLRFATQLALAQRKTESGMIVQLNRREVIDRFAQTKLSPAVGLINDLLKGETYLGEELPPKTAKGAAAQVWNRMMPLAIQDLIDGFNQDGPLGGLVSSAGLLGIGVVTYTDEVEKARDKAAQEKYGMTWDELGRAQGKVAQLRLEQETPSILEAEQEQEKRFATGMPSTMNQWQNEGKSVEETYRKMINQAAAEYRQTGNGVAFREKVDDAAQYRRTAYSARAERKEYNNIVAYYNQPLTEKQKAEMNPGDVLRREFYQRMFGADMYDQYGNYLFEEADRREQEFLQRYGQQALDYIEEYQGARWPDKPAELKMLEQARETLRPYWDVADAVWSLYPKQLKDLADQILILENTNPNYARQLLRQYPQILRARELIANYKKQMRDRNPIINQAYRLFYG